VPQAAVKTKPKSKKARLDVRLVELGLAESRQRAQALILAGKVSVNRQRADKSGMRVAEDATVALTGVPLRYASRGGLKLEAALADFDVDPAGKICLDAGSSTGGFTDCLLQADAARVYAVDVNLAQLAWKLRQDARVTGVERNARYLKPGDIGEAVELVTADLSFISTAKVLPALVPLARTGADFLILVKPQFELDRGDVGAGGIVRDARLHERAIVRVRDAAEAAGLEVLGVLPSRVKGAEGNQEFFLHARRP